MIPRNAEAKINQYPLKSDKFNERERERERVTGGDVVFNGDGLPTAPLSSQRCLRKSFECEWENRDENSTPS